MINRVADDRLREGGFGRLRTADRLKGPVARPLSALLHPALEHFHLGRLERLVLLGGRHDVVLVRRQDSADQLAFLQIPGHHRAFARFGGGERRLPRVEPQLALAFVGVRAVAGKTVFGQDRADVPVEIQLRAERIPAEGGENQGSQEGDLLHVRRGKPLG